MKTSHDDLICSLVVLVMMMLALLSHADQQPHVNENENENENHTTINERDLYYSNVWDLYQRSSSSSSERSKAIKEIRDAMAKTNYLHNKIDMLSLFLYGPANRHSVLRSIRDKNKLPNVNNDPQCLKSTLNLFEKYCGGIVTEHHDMKQSLANICSYVADKVAIEEAILLACAMHTTESHGIDAGNPRLDLTPTPVHGTSHYCGRVSVNGVSRTKLHKYAKSYKVVLVSSQLIYERDDNMIQICFHRNDSLGLCHCENDDWRSLEKGSWSSSMSPYDQRFVDVKFVIQLSGFVTITLDEVSHVWRYGLLLGGIALLLVAGSKDIFYEYVDAGMVQLVKWAMRVLAVTFIFMSSNDTPLAMVAVSSCLVLCYVITSIIAPVLSKKTKLQPRSGLGQGDGDPMGSQSYYYSMFRNIRNRRKFSTSVTELACSPEFDAWVMKNTHRIKLGPEVDKKEMRE